MPKRSARSSFPLSGTKLYCLWLALVLTGQAQARQNSPESSLLPAGQPVERRLEHGQTHSYSFPLTIGQFTRIVVEHHGQDLVLTLFDPAGNSLGDFDQEFRKEGQEVVTHVAEIAGLYRVEVKPKLKNAQPGRYRIVQTELREANEKDRTLQEAWNQRANGEKALREGRYGDALEPLERALKLYQDSYGQEHVEIARVLKILGGYYWLKSGMIEKSLEMHERAAAMREKLLGTDHPESAESLILLSIPWYEKTDYQQAANLLRRGLAIMEQTAGPEHPSVAYALGRLVLVHIAQADFVTAEQLALRALAIREQALGAEHAQVASNLDLLANISLEMGDYDKAERYYVRCRDVFAKALSPTHPNVGIADVNLSSVSLTKGEYEKARRAAQSAVDILEKAQGATFIHVGSTLAIMGDIYRRTGEYEKAKDAYQRAIEIIDKTSGPRTRMMAGHLMNLANVFLDEQAFAKAEPLHQQALDIYSQVLEPGHYENALPLTGLGVIYREQGHLLKAEPMLRRALEVREKGVGADHPLVAASLNELALLLHKQSELQQAELLMRRAVEVAEKSLGPNHFETGKYLNTLAQLHEAQGAMEKATATQTRANAISEHNIGINLIFGSERQRRAYLEMMAREVDRTVSLHLRSAPQQATARDLAFTLVLQRKGRLLETATDDLSLLRRNLTAEEQTLLDRLQTARSQLARLVLNEPPKDKLDQYRAQVREREAQVETAEADISRRSARYRAQTQPVTLAAVQAAIPPDAALVEFVVWRPFDARATRTDQTWGTPRYAAYVLRQQGAAQWVELGEAAQIERTIAAWRQALRKPDSANVRTLARLVDQKIMQPVRALLGDTRQLLISPDGALNLIPFAALVDEQRRFLIERYSFSYLTSGRELLRLGQPRESTSPPLIVANPDFGAATTTEAKTGSGVQLDLSQVYFQPLPGTAGEAKALQQLFPQATVLSRTLATETALKQIAAPSILHIATHGFFLQETEATPTATRRDFRPGNTTNRAAALRMSRLSVNAQNPLLRSGLVLAGANQGQRETDDGILTALESASLNLWGTKLVVLSACDTGVGEVRNGDGVYGLRRALAQAGAETQVMSLWPVADTDTRDLMVGYYKGLQRNQGRSEALRQVQLKMLQSRAQRHPHYWASFIQSGEWANLAGKR